MASKYPINQTLLPTTTSISTVSGDSGDSNDPFKIWVLLYYPDSLKISADKLYTLLDNLSCPLGKGKIEHDPLLMDECEWTLSARVNDTTGTAQSVQQDQSTADDTDQPLNKSASNTSKVKEEATAHCAKDRPMPTDYFCITAPVGHSVNEITEDSCHYVRCYTETVIVDLRYCGTSCIFDTKQLDDIADKVRDTVIDTLGINKDPRKAKYRVYVLKPQDQDRSGVSPRGSICECSEDVDKELDGPVTKRPALSD